jgi:hypothetical protein
MTASTMPKTIHGASTIRSLPVIRISPLRASAVNYQRTRWLCGSREADMVTLWSRCGGRAWRAPSGAPGGDSREDGDHA